MTEKPQSMCFETERDAINNQVYCSELKKISLSLQVHQWSPNISLDKYNMYRWSKKCHHQHNFVSIVYILTCKYMYIYI